MQAEQSARERKRQARQAARFFVVVLFLVGAYFLHGWLAAQTATVSDKAIVFLTVALVFVSYLQWDVMREQNAVIERQLEQVEFQQRAWLAVMPAKIEALPQGESGELVAWKVNAENTGHTPAIIKYSRVEAKLRKINEAMPSLEDIELVTRLQSPTKTVVSPIFRVPFDANRLFIFSQQGEALRNEGLEAYLLACFIYDDVFGNERKTVCRFRYNRDTGQFENAHQDGEMT